MRWKKDNLKIFTLKKNVFKQLLSLQRYTSKLKIDINLLYINSDNQNHSGIGSRLLNSRYDLI